MSVLSDNGHIGLCCDLGNPDHSQQSNKIEPGHRKLGIKAILTLV